MAWAGESRATREVQSLHREVRATDFDTGLMYTSIYARIGRISSVEATSVGNRSAGINGRDERANHRQNEWGSSGPNSIWSVDGHSLLEGYGIPICACIDAYSRFVICICAVNSAHTGVSVRVSISRIRFLWARSVYTPQDSAVDEASEMRTTFRNSMVTIAARDACRVFDGFLRAGTLPTACQHRLCCPQGFIGSISLMSRQHYNAVKGPINSKA